MSQISQKSISGITSITTPAGIDDKFSLHTSNTNEALKIDGAGNLHLNNHVNTTGVSTASNFKTGSSNLHSTGLTVGDTFVHSTGVNGSSMDIDDFISVGTNIHLGNAGVITATSFSGDGSNLTSLPAGLGTALSSTQTDPLNKLYYTNQVLGVGATITVDPPASASKAYTQYADIKVDSDADLIIAEGDDLIPDVLGLADFGNFGGGASAGRIRVNSITNAAANGATTIQNGVVISGMTTITGGLSIGGTITYEDVTNIDSIGIITARSGVDVDDFVSVGSNIHLGNAGVVTATSYRGDGSQLTGIVAGLSTISGVVNVANDLDVDGHTNLDNVSIAGITTFSNRAYLTHDLTITGTAPRVIFTDTNNNSDYRINVDAGNFEVQDVTNSNATRLRIDSSGHMGLGVTPNTNWPTNADFKALQIGTGACVFGRGSGDEDRGGIAVNWYSTGSANKYIGNGNAARIYLADGNIYFSSAGANSSGANAAMTLSDRMILNSSGKLGIGFNFNYTMNSDSTNLVIGDGGGAKGMTFWTAAGADSQTISFQTNETLSRAEGEISYGPTNTSTTANRNAMMFRTNSAERLRIDSSGTVTAVGIVTATVCLGAEGTAFKYDTITQISNIDITNSYATTSTYYKWVLPSAGLYMLQSSMRVRMWGTTGYIQCRLYDNTASSDITNSERMMWEQQGLSGQYTNVNITLSWVINVASGRTIYQQFRTSNQTSGNGIQRDGNGHNYMFWQKLS